MGLIGREHMKESALYAEIGDEARVETAQADVLLARPVFSPKGLAKSIGRAGVETFGRSLRGSEKASG